MLLAVAGVFCACPVFDASPVCGFCVEPLVAGCVSFAALPEVGFVPCVLLAVACVFCACPVFDASPVCDFCDRSLVAGCVSFPLVGKLLADDAFGVEGFFSEEVISVGFVCAG